MTSQQRMQEIVNRLADPDFFPDLRGLDEVEWCYFIGSADRMDAVGAGWRARVDHMLKTETVTTECAETVAAVSAAAHGEIGVFTQHHHKKLSWVIYFAISEVFAGYGSVDALFFLGFWHVLYAQWTNQHRKTVLLVTKKNKTLIQHPLYERRVWTLILRLTKRPLVVAHTLTAKLQLPIAQPNGCNCQYCVLAREFMETATIVRAMERLQ